MAYYAALVSLENTLVKFIGQDPLQILGDENNKQPFNFLMQNVALLLDFLDNFPGSAPQLEKKITHSAEEAECIIEKYVSQNRVNREKVSFLSLSKLLHPIKLTAITIKSILRDLEGIKTKALADDGSRSEGEALSLPESGIRKKKDEVVGFDDDLVRIKHRIFSNDTEMVAIPIVGMGGVGKTTLAKAAFDDYAVVRHFDVRHWVTVSQTYDIRAILLAILNRKSSNETTSLQDLSVVVHQHLHRRRYIIVVDDVWSLDAWDKVKIFLPDNNNGSRILLTTRNEDVASYGAVSSTNIHHLNLMDNERSWRLLEQRLFGEGVCCPPELVELGKTIAEGCKGLPLAIVVIVGILSSVEQTPDSWKKIARDVNMSLSKGGEHFSEILLLSYHHLPHFLKPCFLYFGAYPEDFNIEVTHLITLWVAEGFLKAKPAKLAEEIAYGCLEDLTKRNLIMVTKKEYDGDITICRIHDLLRNLCIRQAEEQKFIYHAKDVMKLGVFTKGISTARRISITSQVSSRSMNPGQVSSRSMNPGRCSLHTTLCSLHTTLCFNNDRNLIDRLLPCKLLRVLDIRAVRFSGFPSEILQLYHLRYLAFRYDRVVDFKVLEGICNLENLETFIVYPPERVILPPGFWTMKNLRHVLVDDYVVLPDPISQGFPLESLQTLLNVYNFRCREEVVELIPNLKNISVHYALDFQREDWYDYNINNFGRFSNLDSFTVNLDLKGNGFLGCLVLPSSLRRLTITKCSSRHVWKCISDTIGSLPNLESLNLSRISEFPNLSGDGDDVWETREGDFQNLRMLEMVALTLNRWMIESSSHFPNLERLVLDWCRDLTEVPDCIGDIPTLQLIKVDRCSEVVVDWARRIGEEQREMGNELLNIEVNQLAKQWELKMISSHNNY